MPLGLIHITGTIKPLSRQGQIFFIVFQFGVHTKDHRQGTTLKYAQNKEHLTGFWLKRGYLDSVNEALEMHSWDSSLFCERKFCCVMLL